MSGLKFSDLLSVAIFIVLIILQYTLVPYLAIEGICPNLPFIYLIYLAMQHNRLWGLFAAAFFGFITDLLSGGILGSLMFSQALAVFISGFMYNEQTKESFLRSWKFGLLILISSAINSFFLWLVTNFSSELNLISVIMQQALLPAIYTSFISLFFIFIKPRREFY
jgi:rod shape-determining protein MreD